MFWSYASIFSLVAISIVTFLKEWDEWPRRLRLVLVPLIVVSGIIAFVTTYLSGVESGRNEQRVAELTQEVKTLREANEKDSERFREAFDRLNERVADLQSKVRTQDLQKQLQQTQEELRATQQALAPKPKASLTFGFFTTDPGMIPIRETVAPVAGESLMVELAAYNLTKVAALNGTIWIRIPPGCKFVKEPAGWQRPEGSPETDRIRAFHQISPNTMSEKITVEVSVPQHVGVVMIGMSAECETCAAMGGFDRLKVSVLR